MEYNNTKDTTKEVCKEETCISKIQANGYKYIKSECCCKSQSTVTPGEQRREEKKREEEEKEMGSFGRIKEFLLEKCLKPWDWLFSPNEVDEGGKTKVRGLKLRPTRTFLGKLIVSLSCAPTGLTIVVGIQDHGLKIGL